MVGEISRTMVSQSYTKHVDLVDSKKTGKAALPLAPNQNIVGGTRGEFKASLDYFKESMRGFLDSPLGKKIAFLQDRIALRSTQKKEVANFEMLERRDEKRAKGMPKVGIDSPQVWEGLKPGVTEYDAYHSSASVNLTRWVDELQTKAHDNGTTYEQERDSFATNIVGLLGREDIVRPHKINIPAFERMEVQFRAEGRHEKADLLGAIVAKLKTNMTHTQVDALWRQDAIDYVNDFAGKTDAFWRNNNTDGEKGITALLTRSFMDPFKDIVYTGAKKIPLSDGLIKLNQSKAAPRAANLNQSESDEIKGLAIKIMDVIDKIEITGSMKLGFETIKTAIENSNQVDKDGITRKLYTSASLLKSVVTDIAGLGHAQKLATMMIYETLFDNRVANNEPFGIATASLKEQLGARGENFLERLGMPRHCRLDYQQPPIQNQPGNHQNAGGNVVVDDQNLALPNTNLEQDNLDIDIQEIANHFKDMPDFNLDEYNNGSLDSVNIEQNTDNSSKNIKERRPTDDILREINNILSDDDDYNTLDPLAGSNNPVNQTNNRQNNVETSQKNVKYDPNWEKTLTYNPITGKME